MKTLTKSLISIILLLSLVLGGSSHLVKIQSAERLPLPILVYHGVSKENKDTKWSITSNLFEKHIAYLVNNNYHVITIADVFQAWQKHEPLPPKSVVITFDDTYADHYLIVYPLLKKYKLKATMFIVTGSIGHKDSLTWENILEMNRSKLIDFEVHSTHHINLKSVSISQVKKELGEAKGILEQKLNKPIIAISYPFGIHSENIKSTTQEMGFKMAFTLHPGFIDQSQNPMDLNRIPITPVTKIQYVLSDFYDRLHHTLHYLQPKDF